LNHYAKTLLEISVKHLYHGKTNKYLKYAVDEIILVVIGILIALQFNNRNVSRIIKIP
jgi:hypothetical protein